MKHAGYQVTCARAKFWAGKTETEPEPEISEYDESDQDNSSDGTTPVEIQDESALVEIQEPLERDRGKEYQRIFGPCLLIFPPPRV